MAYSPAANVSVSVVFPVIGFLLVCVRFWMRAAFQKTYFGIDDWTILIASILVIGMGVNFILGTYIGTMGMDGQAVIPWREAIQKKLDFSVLVFEKPAYGAIKLSVLFFYRRIFTLRSFRIINNYLVALIVTWTLAFFFADLLSCGAHPEANWDPQAKAEAHCINLFVMLLVFAITDVLTDVAIMWMPYPQIKKLHMDTKEKWALASIFMLGLIDLVIGIVRMGFVIGNQTRPALSTDFNPPESTAPTFWTVTEVGIGVIAANLPALAPLFRERARLYSSLRSKLSRSSGTKTGDHVKATHHQTSSEETRVGSFDARMIGSRQKHKSEHVGAWDQFEMAETPDAGPDAKPGLHVQETV